MIRDICSTCAPSQFSYDEYTVSPTVSGNNYDMVRERTGHPPSYVEAKKIKTLTLYTHGRAKG